jgi:hypothetical protein
MQSPYITIGKPTIVVIPEYKVRGWPYTAQYKKAG